MFKFDLLFEIEVPRPWEAGKEASRFHEALEQAVFAEQNGFSTIWLVEHHFLAEAAHSSAPDAMIGALSQRTSTIRLGFGVTLLPGEINHPIRVAERTATADILTRGRLEVGTGRSSSPYQLRAFGTDVATTRSQWEESLRLLPRLWREEGISYHGNHWSWDDEVTVVPKPVQSPHPPLWVASTQPDTCELAGSKGIGLLMPALGAPEDMRNQIKAYKTAIENPADQIGEFTNNQAALFCVAFCADDDAMAREVGGPAGLWYLRTLRRIYASDWSGQPLETVPDSYQYHAKRRMRASGNWAVDVDLTDDVAAYEQMIEKGAFCVGNPERVASTIEKYIEAGGDRLVCVMQLADLRHEDLMRSIELFGKDVIPRVRRFEEQRAEQLASK